MAAMSEKDKLRERKRNIERNREREIEREREGGGKGGRERGREGGNSRRERECGREIRQEEERSGESGREDDFPPPVSSRDGSNFPREETRGEREGGQEREMLDTLSLGTITH